MSSIDPEWVPLSVRRGLREVSGLSPGLPKHLHRPVAYWFEGAVGYRSRDGMRPSLIHSIATRAEVELKSTGDPDMMRELIGAGEADSDLYLDIIDATLSTGHGQGHLLRRILDEGRSIWTVSDDGLALTERVDPIAAESFGRATEPRDVATEELTEAWMRAYGRAPDSSDAWDHAIKAVEALLIPLIVPNQDKPTLAHVIGMLDSSGGRFALELGDGDGIPTLVSMLRRLWPNPDRHASPDHRREPGEQEARAAVHLAVTIVQWARDGLIKND